MLQKKLWGWVTPWPPFEHLSEQILPPMSFYTKVSPLCAVSDAFFFLCWQSSSGCQGRAWRQAGGWGLGCQRSLCWKPRPYWGGLVLRGFTSHVYHPLLLLVSWWWCGLSQHRAASEAWAAAWPDCDGAENRSSIERSSPGASCKAYHSCSPKEKGWGMCLSEFSHSLWSLLTQLHAFAGRNFDCLA